MISLVYKIYLCLVTLCCFSLSFSKKRVLVYVPSQKSHDNFQKQGMVTVNHMNHDIAEVNGSDPPMLPGSFLYKKEPGYPEKIFLIRYSSLPKSSVTDIFSELNQNRSSIGAVSDQYTHICIRPVRIACLL